MSSQRSSKLSHDALILALLGESFVENTKVEPQPPPERTRDGGNDSPQDANNADSANRFSDMEEYGNECETNHPEQRQLASSSSCRKRDHTQSVGEPFVVEKLWEALSRVEEDIKQTGPFQSILDVQKRRYAVSAPSSNSSDGLILECEGFENVSQSNPGHVTWATERIRAVSPFRYSIKEAPKPFSSSLGPTMSFHSNSEGKEMWECCKCHWRIRSRKRDAKDLLTHASVARLTPDMDSARNVESSRSRGLGS